MNWPHRISKILAAATLGLIYVGGLVTSTHSALAVPDWPLSYGQLMPPMVGGILFEHGHRIVATGVGLLTIICAIVFSIKEDRKWVKRLAWAAVGLVILQGVLGGMTVLLRLPWFISASHATMAQSFFALVVALAVWSSPFWKSPPKQYIEPKNVFPLHLISIVLTAILFLQLIVGSLVRHTGYLFLLHVVGAVLIAILAGWVHLRVWQNHFDIKPLRAASSGLVGLIVLQLVLGITTFILLTSKIQVLSHPLASAAIISLHVVVGAGILGLSVIVTLLTIKIKPEENRDIKTMLADYLQLTKPGISFMAGITALAGFVLGSNGDVDLAKLFHTVVGTLMIAGGAGTLNMLIEKDSDALMKRTAKRPLPSGRMKPGEVLFVGTFLSVLSIVYLSWAVNFLTAIVAGLTLSIYLYVYTPLKKMTSLCTIVGAVAGALPPVIGWAAATNGLGIEAWVLFGIIFFWQFPHFFSLAWIYRNDYADGGLHMLPGKTNQTALGILVNSVGLLLISLVPTFLNLTGQIYLISAILLGAWMLFYSVQFYRNHSQHTARKLFFASLAYIPILVIFMLINRTPIAS